MNKEDSLDMFEKKLDQLIINKLERKINQRRLSKQEMNQFVKAIK